MSKTREIRKVLKVYIVFNERLSASPIICSTCGSFLDCVVIKLLNGELYITDT